MFQEFYKNGQRRSTEPIRRRGHQNGEHVFQVGVPGLKLRDGGCEELGGETTCESLVKVFVFASSDVNRLQNLPVTKIVDNLMDFKSSQEMDEYHYLDPKQLKLAEIPKSRSPFQDAMVFVVGGGNYIEYQNLVDYAKVRTTLMFGVLKYL